MHLDDDQKHNYPTLQHYQEVSDESSNMRAHTHSKRMRSLPERDACPGARRTLIVVSLWSGVTCVMMRSSCERKQRAWNRNCGTGSHHYRVIMMCFSCCMFDGRGKPSLQDTLQRETIITKYSGRREPPLKGHNDHCFFCCTLDGRGKPPIQGYHH